MLLVSEVKNKQIKMNENEENLFGIDKLNVKNLVSQQLHM